MFLTPCWKENIQTRILRVLAYALAIFTEYTVWTAFALGGVSWKWPEVTFLHEHINYCIFDLFLISQSEQNCKWGIKYVHLVTTDHMSSTCAHYYPHTKFHQRGPYRTLDFWFFLVISQSKQMCKWGIKYVHLVTTDHMGSTCAHHYPYTKVHQCSPYRTLDIWLFCY